ncbi:MAG: hypothetical protein WA277_08830 [Nitrospirota bacterium]
MITGLNTDVTHDGVTYHVQTEDSGLKNPFIVTHCFVKGAIIATKKTSYADILKADCLPDVVKDLMNEQHKQMMRDVVSGGLKKKKSDEKFGDDVISKKSLDEVILDFLGKDDKENK